LNNCKLSFGILYVNQQADLSRARAKNSEVPKRVNMLSSQCAGKGFKSIMHRASVLSSLYSVYSKFQPIGDTVLLPKIPLIGRRDGLLV
jgi:hypothetical protein